MRTVFFACLVLLILSSCRREEQPQPVYCWRCYIEDLIYDSYTRQPIYHVDSVDKCSMTEQQIREFEHSMTYKSLAVDTAGVPIDTAYSRASCHKL